MTDVRDTIERSRRGHTKETAGGSVFIPGQTIGHHGGRYETCFAWCKEDAPDSDTITCWLDYPERNVRVWLKTVIYIVGNKVTSANKFWLSKDAANLNHTPAEDAYWTEITAYNEATTYNITTAVWTLYDNKLWRSLQAGNVGHLPTEGAWWTTKAKAYNAGTTYPIGERATSGGKLWRSLVASNIGHTPAAGLFWAEIPEIEVYCNIAGGNSLQFAFPLLAEQQMIWVKYSSANARYEAVQLFQACEVRCAAGGMLELVNEMLVTDIPSSNSGVWVNANYMGVGLRLSAYANSTYIIEFSIIYTTAATATGIVLGVTGPAEKISISGAFFGQNANANPGLMAGKTFNAYYDVAAGVCEFADSAAGVNFIRGECVLQNGPIAGEFYLKFHTGANGSAVVLKTGSNIKYRRIYREGTP